MKKTYYHILLLCMMALCLLPSCSGNADMDRYGWLQIAKPLSDTLLHTRAVAEDEIDYMVSITQGGETVMSPTRFSTIDGSIPLSAGTGYTLFAESCSPDEAESVPTVYGQPRYVGTEVFDIIANQPTDVTVHCAMANAAFKVQKDASFYYTSFTVTASCNGRSLSFTNDEDMGYFNVAAGETATLQYEIVATDAEGNTGRGSGSLLLKPRNLSKLTLKANAPGSIELSVNYDDTFTPYVTEIVLED